MKYSLARFRSKHYPAFNLQDVIRTGVPKGYAKILVHNELKKGELKRIKQGWYTYHDDPMLAVFAFAPAYLGLEAALSIYGLWEQQTVPVIITAKKVRTGVREILGSNMVIHRTSPAQLTGYQATNYYGFWLPVSTPKKTYADILHFREKLDPGTLRKLRALARSPAKAANK